MAAITAYEQLQQNVADASARLKSASDALAALKNDPKWISLYSIWSDPRVQSGTGWVDASGVYWNAADAQAQHNAARSQVVDYQAKIKAAIDVVTDAQNGLNNSQKAVSDYETNSPVGAQIATAAASALKSQTVKNVLYVIGTLVVIGLLISLVRWYEKSHKPKAA